MSGAKLFVACRRPVRTLLLLLALTTIVYLRRAHMAALPNLFGGQPVFVHEAFIFAAFLSMAIAVGLRTGMESWERVAARRLYLWRLGYVLTLVSIVIILLSIALRGVEVAPLGRLAVLRNVLGFAGLTLLGVTFFGSRGSWILPLPIVLAYLLIGSVMLLSSRVPWWAWPYRGGHDAVAWCLSTTLLIAGLVSYSLHLPAEQEEEPPELAGEI